MQVKMVMMKESTVIRYLSHVTDDMIQNNRKEIRCSCQKCKLRTLFNPFFGKVLEHLLMSDFMDGHTQWMGEDGNEDEVHEDNNNEGQEDDIDEEHDDADEDHDQEEHVDDEDTQTPLTSAMHDPHLQELLARKTGDARGAAREKAKLVQLEIDSTTPLYPGCTMEDTRLKVALDVLQMKAKYKWTDTSVNASLKYWHDRLPDGNTCPSSVDEAKKVVCPLDLPHEKYHACINNCYIYRKEEDSNKTTCPVCNAT
jgi:hypothetical protein